VAPEADLAPSGVVMAARRHLAHVLPLLLPARLDLRRACERSWVCWEAMSECGEQASPRVVIDLGIEAPAGAQRDGSGLAAVGSEQP
jgi:hypothetical protein